MHRMPVFCVASLFFIHSSPRQRAEGKTREKAFGEDLFFAVLIHKKVGCRSAAVGGKGNEIVLQIDAIGAVLKEKGRLENRRKWCENSRPRGDVDDF